jgi:hypothetical protein
LVGRAQFAINPKPATSWAITNKHRQKVGDIYNPDHNRRLQIRNNHRQIIGYIERDGTVTNTSRQLWVPKTLSTAEKWGFGLKKEGFSNWGTRTEWPLSKVKSSGAKLADEVLRTSRNSSAKSNDSNFRDPHHALEHGQFRRLVAICSHVCPTRLKIAKFFSVQGQIEQTKEKDRTLNFLFLILDLVCGFELALE